MDDQRDSLPYREWKIQIYILVIENYNKLKYKTKNNINTNWKNKFKNIKSSKIEKVKWNIKIFCFGKCKNI